MRVLGFDPGTATTGYGVVEGKGNRLTHVAHGAITTPAKQHFAERLKTIHERVILCPNIIPHSSSSSNCSQGCASATISSRISAAQPNRSTFPRTRSTRAAG